MKPNLRVLRTILIWIAILAATLISGVAAILETGVLTPRLVDWVNGRLEQQGGLHLETASIYLRPGSGLTLDDVWLTIPSKRAMEAAGASEGRAPDRVPPSFGSAPRNSVFSVGQIEVGYRVSGLLRGTPRLRRVKLVRPDLDVAELQRWLASRDVEEEGADEEDAAAGEGGGGAGAGLARRGLRIDELRILEGRVEGSDGTVISGLRLAGRLEKRDDAWWMLVDAAGAHVTSDRIDEELELTGDLGINPDGVQFDGLHLGVAGGRLSFEGGLDPSGETPTELRAQGFALSLGRVASWFGVAHPLLDADLELRLLVTGRPDSLALTGGFRGETESGAARNFRFAGVHRGDRVDLEFLRAAIGEADLELSGRLLLGEQPGADGVAVFRNVDPAVLLADEDFASVSGLDGVVYFQGTGFTRDTFEGSADLRVSRATLFGLPIDSAEFHPKISNGELTLSSATLRKGDSVISGLGSIDRNDQVVSELTGQVADLADLGGVLGGVTADALQGTATIDVRVLGPLRGPALEATLRFEDASVFGATARSLAVDLAADTLGTATELRVEATGEGIGYGGREIPKAMASGEISAGALNVRRLRLESDRRGSLTLAGDMSVAGDSLSGQIGRFEVVPTGGGPGWTNQGTIRLQRSEGSFEISGVDLRQGAGRVRADVTINPTGDTFVKASGRGVELADFSPFLLTPKAMAGALEFDADAMLGPDTLAADLRIDLVDGRWGEDTLERIEGSFSLRDDRVVFDELVFRSSLATADLDGEMTLPSGSFRDVFADSTTRARTLDRVLCSDLVARMEAPDWSWFWDITPWPDLGCAGSIRMEMDGPAKNPTAELWLRLVNGDLGTEPLEEAVGQGRYADGRLTIDEGWVRSGAGRVVVGGGLPIAWSFAQPKPEFLPGQPFDLTLKGTRFPIQAISAFVPLFEMVQGTAEADLVLSGVKDSTYFLGDFSLVDGRLTIPTFVDPLIGGVAFGRFDENGVEVVDARMTDGQGGNVSGSGRVELFHLNATDWDFVVAARDYHYHGEINGIRGVGSGTLKILAVPQGEGEPPLPKFVGVFDVDQAEMDERVLLPPSSRDARPEMPAGVNAPAQMVEEFDEDVVPPPLVFSDIDFRAENNLWLRTPEMQVELAGDVSVQSTPEYVGLIGSLRTLQGTYIVANTVFDLESAEARFFDPSDPEATSLDAEATTRVLDEEVTALVTGTLLLPNIQLSTESGMTEREIYELLALRQKRTENGAPVEEEGMVSSDLVASWGAVLASRFGQELGREVGLDTFEVDRGQTTTHVGLGKSLGRSFFLRYREQVANNEDATTTTDVARERLETPERQLLLEYRLSQMFQLQGEAGTIEGDGYLNVDLKAEWGY